MSWILPTAIPSLRGRLRTVGDPGASERQRAARQRWRASPKYRAWVERRRDARIAYDLAWHKANKARRSKYLAEKKREYRARMKASSSNALGGGLERGSSKNLSLSETSKEVKLIRGGKTSIACQEP